MFLIKRLFNSKAKSKFKTIITISTQATSWCVKKLHWNKRFESAWKISAAKTRNKHRKPEREREASKQRCSVNYRGWF